MNQKPKRKCPKGGQHKNRHIEAICIQQSCKSDRLVCFYCIHQNHQNHQIVHLLEGLDSPIQRLGVNGRIENREDHQKYIKKKIRKINHGWKNLYRIFADYINKIERNLQPQIQAIEDSFDQTSAKKFASVITDPETTQQTVQKYVEKIKLILKYDLSDVNQLKVSTGVAYQDLKQAYATADKQIRTVMEKIVRETNLFSVLNCGLVGGGAKRESRLGIDDRNRVSISIEKDKLTVNSYESRCEGSKGLYRRVENRWLEKRTQLLKVKNNHQMQRLIQEDSQSWIETQRVQARAQQKSENDSNLSQSNVESQKNSINDDQIHQSSKHQEEIMSVESSKQNKQYLDKQKMKIKKDNFKKYKQFFEKESQEERKDSFDEQPERQQSPLHEQLHEQNESEQEQLESSSKQKIQCEQIEMAEIPATTQPHKKPQTPAMPKTQPNLFPQPKQQELDPSQLNIPQQPYQQSSQSSSQACDLNRYIRQEYSQSQTPSIINLKQIYLSAHSLTQIHHYLKRIPTDAYPYVRSLEIVCDTLPLAVNNAIIAEIVKFKALKKLVICQASGMKKQHILAIATHLTDLQHLVLQQNYQIKDDLTDLIVKKLKRLKKFHYTSDPLEHLFFKQQNTQFMLEVDGNTKFHTFAKLTDLPHLQTIAIENIIRTNDIKTHLTKLKKISQLSILYHSKQHKINPIIDVLSRSDSAKSLISLQLKQAYFREDALIEVIENCRTLRFLGLNKCRDVTNRTIASLKKHRNTLRQLDLMQQDGLTGHGFQHLVQLQILSLKACWQVQEEVLGKNISALTKLKALNLNFNRYWVTQNIFEHIAKMNNLELLQIDNNKVNYKALFRLRLLTKLTTLVCGNTQVTGEEIAKFLSILSSKLQKLSLKRQMFEQKSSKKQISNKPFQGSLLKQISRYAPGLTHLNIKGMKQVLKSHLQQLTNIKCLCVDVGQLDEATLEWLNKKKVSLYVGYEHLDTPDPSFQDLLDDQNCQPEDQVKVKLEQ